GKPRVGLDALAIMELSEQLYIKGERQYCPCALAEHGVGDSVGVDIEAVALGQHLADHRIDAAEQFLMLQLLIAESKQCLERDLITEPVVSAQLEDLGIDEAFNQPKDVGVCAALDLAHESLLIGRQGVERIDKRKPVRKKLLRGVEAAPADNVLIYVPAHP